jgi:hypothetical protein
MLHLHARPTPSGERATADADYTHAHPRLQAACAISPNALRACNVDVATGVSILPPLIQWKALLSELCAPAIEPHPELGHARRCMRSRLSEHAYPAVHLRGALAFAHRTLIDPEYKPRRQQHGTSSDHANTGAAMSNTFWVPASDEGLERMFNQSMALRQPLSLFGPLFGPL